MNRGNEARKAELHRQMEDALNAINYTHNKPQFTDQRQQAWESYFDAQKQLYALNQHEMNKDEIQALRAQIEGLRQDLAFGVITKAEFGVERGKLLAQIEILDTRPNCTYSAWPEPEGAPLRQAKKRCREQIEPYKNRIGIPKYNALLIALQPLTTIDQVEKLYNEYRDLIALKQIAQLPDLHQKPATRNKAA